MIQFSTAKSCNVKVLEKKAKVIYVTRNPRDAVVRMISSEEEGTFL